MRVRCRGRVYFAAGLHLTALKFRLYLFLRFCIANQIVRSGSLFYTRNRAGFYSTQEHYKYTQHIGLHMC
jgi:hypothetical protein